MGILELLVTGWALHSAIAPYQIIGRTFAIVDAHNGQSASIMNGGSNTGRHSLARTVHIHLTDDIDGSQADETIEFGVDGVTYEIDLSAANATALRAAFKAYVEAGRKAGRGIRTTAGRRPASPVARSDRSQNRAIRDWANRKGLTLSERGRIPGHIVQQFEAEAGR